MSDKRVETLRNATFSTECTVRMVEGDLERSATMDVWCYGAQVLRCKPLRGVYMSHTIYCYMGTRQIYLFSVEPVHPCGTPFLGQSVFS